MSLKSARAGVAPRAKTLSAIRISRRRLVIVVVLPMPRMRAGRDVRDSELPFQAGQLLQIDGADDVYDGELFRFCGDDQKSGDAVAARVGVDVDVFARAAGDLHDLLPRRSELLADALGLRLVVFAFVIELVAADVDAGQAVDHLLRGALVGVVAVEELAGEAEHRAVERDVDGLAGLRGHVGKIEIDARALRRSGDGKRERGDEGEDEVRE